MAIFLVLNILLSYFQIRAAEIEKSNEHKLCLFSESLHVPLLRDLICNTNITFRYHFSLPFLVFFLLDWIQI